MCFPIEARIAKFKIQVQHCQSHDAGKIITPESGYCQNSLIFNHHHHHHGQLLGLSTDESCCKPYVFGFPFLIITLVIDSLTVTTYLATSLPVDITDLRKSVLPVSSVVDANFGIGFSYSDLQNTGGGSEMNTDFPTEVDDTTGERQVASNLLTGETTPQPHPVQLRQRSRRGVSPYHQYWEETRRPLTSEWVNNRPAFLEMRPPSFDRGNALEMVWSPNMPPIECKCHFLASCKYSPLPVWREHRQMGETSAEVYNSTGASLADVSESAEVSKSPTSSSAEAFNLADVSIPAEVIGSPPAEVATRKCLTTDLAKLGSNICSHCPCTSLANAPRGFQRCRHVDPWSIR